MCAECLLELSHCQSETMVANKLEHNDIEPLAETFNCRTQALRSKAAEGPLSQL